MGRKGMEWVVMDDLIGWTGVEGEMDGMQLDRIDWD